MRKDKELSSECHELLDRIFLISFSCLSDSADNLYNEYMANGEEDLREKNRGRRTEAGEKRYSRWSQSLGREDAEMLLEKADRGAFSGKRKAKWTEED